METTTSNMVEFTRVNNDVNGNPRFVCHFLAFINDRDEAKAKELQERCRPFQSAISHLYDIALNKSRQLGGRKFSNKQYGGGIVFQMYDGERATMSERINQIKNQ